MMVGSFGRLLFCVKRLVPRPLHGGIEPLPQDHDSFMMKTCKTCSSHLSHKVFATSKSKRKLNPLTAKPLQAEVGNIAECQGILAILRQKHKVRCWSHKTLPRRDS